jgi:hypothetical protein
MKLDSQSWTNLAFAMQEIFFGHVHDAIFLDAEDLALVDMLENVTAGEASQPVAGTSCVAAQAKHIIFSIRAYINAVKAGDALYITDNWPEWDETPVQHDEWETLKKQLRLQVDSLLRFLKAQKGDDVSVLAMGALAHMAFHLGSMQTKYAVLKSN